MACSITKEEFKRVLAETVINKELVEGKSNDILRVNTDDISVGVKSL